METLSETHLTTRLMHEERQVFQVLYRATLRAQAQLGFHYSLVQFSNLLEHLARESKLNVQPVSQVQNGFAIDDAYWLSIVPETSGLVSAARELRQQLVQFRQVCIGWVLVPARPAQWLRVQISARWLESKMTKSQEHSEE
jgi:hypothetical protein